MDIQRHKTATITSRIRQEIQQAPVSASDSKLALVLSRSTIARNMADLTRTPPAHDAVSRPGEIMVGVRETLRLNVGNLLTVAKKFLDDSVTLGASAPLEKPGHA